MSKYPNVECGECPVWLGGKSREEMLKYCRERHCDLLGDEEQINEMVRVIAEVQYLGGLEQKVAQLLFEKGYRRVERGEWELNIDGSHWCSVCGHNATYTYDGTEVCGVSCPFCGVDMRVNNDGE